jgi:hypothetical protein
MPPVTLRSLAPANPFPSPYAMTSPDILIPIGIVVILVGAGVAFGVQKQRVDSAHERIDALDKRVTALLIAIEVKMDAVIRLVERIDERTKRQGGDR